MVCASVNQDTASSIPQNHVYRLCITLPQTRIQRTNPQCQNQNIHLKYQVMLRHVDQCIRTSVWEVFCHHLQGVVQEEQTWTTPKVDVLCFSEHQHLYTNLYGIITEDRSLYEHCCGNIKALLHIRQTRMYLVYRDGLCIPCGAWWVVIAPSSTEGSIQDCLRLTFRQCLSYRWLWCYSPTLELNLHVKTDLGQCLGHVSVVVNALLIPNHICTYFSSVMSVTTIDPIFSFIRIMRSVD